MFQSPCLLKRQCYSKDVKKTNYNYPTGIREGDTIKTSLRLRKKVTKIQNPQEEGEKAHMRAENMSELEK